MSEIENRDQALEGGLALSSERFRARWARQDIRGLEGGTTTP